MTSPDKEADLAAFNAWCLAIRTKLESPTTEATMELAKQYGARTTTEPKLQEVASWFNWGKVNKAFKKPKTEKPETEEPQTKEHLTLKSGTLKSWRVINKRSLEILEEWGNIPSVETPPMFRLGIDPLPLPTVEERVVVCKLIDAVDAEEIYLEWDDKYVTKEEAKAYVTNYGSEHGSPQV